MNMLTLLKEKLQGALQSIVMWFNTLMAAAVPFLDYAQTQIPLLFGIVPGNLYGWAFGSVIAVNMLFRAFRDNGPLEDKPLPTSLKQ